MKLDKLSMQFSMGETDWAGSVLEAYERLIYDAARGDRTLFTSAEGIERLWEISQRFSTTRRSCGRTTPARGGPTRSTSSSPRSPGASRSSAAGATPTSVGPDPYRTRAYAVW